MDDGARTPKASDNKRPKSKGNSSIDPALRGEESSDSGSTPAARSEGDDKRQEDWVENIRTIETLRKWISERLSRGDFEEDSEVSSDTREGAEEAKRVQAEIARLVEAKMADGGPKPVDGGDVKYPSLPTA